MSVRILQGDVREMLATLEPESAQCVVTSPPYFRLRDYGTEGQIGMEATPAEFVATLVDVFEGVRRVLRSDGCLFVNLGDSYSASGGHSKQGATSQRKGRSNISAQNFGATTAPAGIPAKNLLLIPQRFAIAMQDAGWIVRQEIVWAKRAPMPESVRDRCTSAWEPIYMFTKQGRYYWDQDAVRQPNVSADDARNRPDYIPNRERNVGGRSDGYTSAHGAMGWNAAGANLRNVWDLSPEPSRENHYAAFPTEIPRRCILAASRRGDTVLDPFLGSGTTALVADQLGRNAVGIELNGEYAEMARRRIAGDAPLLTDVEIDARASVAAHETTQAQLWEVA